MCVRYFSLLLVGHLAERSRQTLGTDLAHQMFSNYQKKSSFTQSVYWDLGLRNINPSDKQSVCVMLDHKRFACVWVDV